VSDELRKLLATHDFLNEAIKSHGAELGLSGAGELLGQRDETFLKLLKFVSADPRVSLAQIECFVSSLASLAPEPEQGAVLRNACVEIAARLAEQAAANASVHNSFEDARPLHCPTLDKRQTPAAQYGAMLDSISDRAGLFDLDYRYTLTNRVNADFHLRSPDEFRGKPSWLMVGDENFSRFTKPSLDQCYAGHSVSLFASYKRGRSRVTYSLKFDPIRDAKGDVQAVFAVARDVSKISVRSKVVWPGPPPKEQR
jgi:PAS domain-containing protein